jgi:hypothetical protein
MTEVPDVPQPKYATHVPGRRPAWKFHTNLGHAKNAVGQSPWFLGARGGRIFEWDNGEWVLLWEIKGGTDRKQLPWVIR